MAKKKSKKKTSSLIMFIVATVLFLACLSIAIAFSVIPHALTPYTFKGEDTSIQLTINDDYSLVIKEKDSDPYNTTFKYGDFIKPLEDKGIITPFVIEYKGSFGPITAETDKNLNGGNIAIVTIASLLGLISLGLALSKAKKAF